MIVNPLNIYAQFKAAQIGKQQYSAFPKFGLSAKNLAPLEKDTFTCSFKGAGELKGEDMPFAPDTELCESVNYFAQIAEQDLKLTLGKYLEKINKGAKKGKEPITIKVRRKTPESIREKVVAKYGKISENEKNEFCHNAISEIFKYYSSVEDDFVPLIAEMNARTLMDLMLDDIKVPPYKHEKKFLSEIISDFKKCNFIKYSTKNKPESQAIKEMAERLSTTTKNEYCDEKGAYLNTKDVFGIKHYVNDLIGARVVLNNSNQQTVQNVIDEIKHAADNGRLKITSVENILPEVEESKLEHYKYLPDENLKAFAKRTGAEYKERKSKLGYMAIHVNFELKGNRFFNKHGKTKEEKNIFNGYKGEIQIMDSNIETLKNIEDLCYKLKDNKNIPIEEYDIFKKYFSRYYDKLNDSEKAAFDDYTYKSYLAQRNKSLAGEKRTLKTFESIKKLGFDGCFSSELDFNELKKIKESCDRNIEKNHPDLKLPKDVDFFKIYKKPSKDLRKMILEYGIQFEE